ncbi:MAG TPA: hypothetical protein VNA25_27870 [Phycisphaerae bacterium]|nr:hypothetical protein [Phycisphaerae bacterium]
MDTTIRRFVAVLLSGTLACMVGLGGCSDESTRRASRNLRREVAESQRSYAKALRLLGNPVYEDARGRPVRLPGAEIEDPEQIKVLPPEALHPDALGFLDPNALDKALDENAAADPADKSLAHGQAGRVWELKAFYHGALASNGRSELQELLAKAQVQVYALQLQAGRLKHLDALLAMTPAEAKALLGSAGKQAQDKGAELKTLEGQIATLTNRGKALRTKYEGLAREAVDLRLQGNALTGKKGLDLTEQAIAKQSQANQASSELAGIENTLVTMQSQRKSLAAEVRLAEALQALANDTISAATTQAASYKTARDGVVARIADGQKDMDRLVGEMTELIAKVRDDEDKATNAYALAGTHLEKAETVLSPQAGTNPTAKRADVAAALAELYGRSLRLRGRLDALSQQLKLLWPALQRPNEMPEAYGTLASKYIVDPDKTKEIAQKSCQDAVDFCTRMIPKVDRLHRWVYQGQIGSAYLSLYQVGGDREYLSKADEALSEALQGKETSPYLADIREIRSYVQVLLQSSAGSGT